jgi:hypothetical protein
MPREVLIVDAVQITQEDVVNAINNRTWDEIIYVTEGDATGPPACVIPITLIHAPTEDVVAFVYGYLMGRTDLRRDVWLRVITSRDRTGLECLRWLTNLRVWATEPKGSEAKEEEDVEDEAVQPLLAGGGGNGDLMKILLEAVGTPAGGAMLRQLMGSTVP